MEGHSVKRKVLGKGGPFKLCCGRQYLPSSRDPYHKGTGGEGIQNKDKKAT